MGTLANGVGQMAGNLVSRKPVMDGVAQAVIAGAVTGGLVEGAGTLLKGVGEDAATVVSEGRSSLDLEGTTCSFTSTTVVATTHGEQAIGTLQVGDKVEAYNPKTHTMEVQPILHVGVYTDNDLVDLTLTTTTSTQDGKPVTRTSETIHTNQKHPFFTLEQGFLPVAKITLGMHVLRADGMYGVVTGWRIVPGAKVMYNLEVAQDHTFTVGDGQWVVHNCNFGSNKDPINMEHILEGHSNGTYESLLQRTANGDQRAANILSHDTYFVGQTDEEVGKIVREAWINRVKAGSQQIDPMGVARQMWRGTGRGWQVEGWYNLTERIVETAYPIF